MAALCAAAIVAVSATVTVGFKLALLDSALQLSSDGRSPSRISSEGVAQKWSGSVPDEATLSEPAEASEPSEPALDMDEEIHRAMDADPFELELEIERELLSEQGL